LHLALAMMGYLPSAVAIESIMIHLRKAVSIVCTCACLFPAIGALANDSSVAGQVKETAQQVGQKAKEAGKEVADGAKKVAKDVADGAKQAGKQVADTAKKVRDDVSNKKKSGD